MRAISTTNIVKLLIAVYFLIALPDLLYAQNRNFLSRLIDDAIARRKEKNEHNPKKERFIYQRYRMWPSQYTELKECRAKGFTRCSYDTFSYRGVSVNLSFAAAMPLGIYAKSVSKGAYGLSWGLEYQPASKAPFSIGISMNALIAAVQNLRINIPFTINSGGQYLSTVNVPLQLNVKNNLFHTHGVARFWVPCRFVQPYIQALGGFVYANTNLKFYDNNSTVLLGIGNEGLIYEIRPLQKATWSAGASLGLGINLSYAINLDLRATYLQSGKLQYYTNDAVKNWDFNYNGSAADFSSRKVNTDKVNSNVGTGQMYSEMQMLVFTAGITVFFE